MLTDEPGRDIIFGEIHLTIAVKRKSSFEIYDRDKNSYKIFL